MTAALIHGGEIGTMLLRRTLADAPRSYSAEGVQIGNVDSALGMAGIWSVALHEEGILFPILLPICELIIISGWRSSRLVQRYNLFLHFNLSCRSVLDVEGGRSSATRYVCNSGILSVFTSCLINRCRKHGQSA